MSDEKKVSSTTLPLGTQPKSEATREPDPTPEEAAARTNEPAEAEPAKAEPASAEGDVSGSLDDARSPEAIKAEWAKKPAVEIELVHELRSPPYVDQPWRMLEIWTQNRIYAIDSNMHCIDVVDQASQQPVRDHGLLGARLVGGQHREGEAMHLSHPFPRPGTEAVFEQQTKGKGASFSQSSTVTRVVLRLRHVTIGSGMEIPTWDQISGSFPPTFRSG